MKKLLLLVAMMLCCATAIFAQNNHKISYQAVVRDTANKLVANETVTVTVNIYNGEVTTTSTVTEPVYTQTQTVTTNLNGLISLMIGPEEETAEWNNIQWNHANMVTTVTLDNVLLGTLSMPLTAVPYALYAKEISPDGTVVTNIYNKMQQDSADLAEKMRADSLLLHRALVDSAGNIRSALVDSTINIRGALVDSTINIRGALVDSAGNIRTALTDSVRNIDTRMNVMATTLHNEITTLDTKVTTRMNTISDSVKTNYNNIAINRQAIIDSTAHIRHEIDTTSEAIRNTLTTTANAIRSEVDTKLQSYAQLNGNNTFSGNNTFTGPVTANSVTVTCGNSNLDICTMYNELTQLIAGMQNTIDSLKDVITELLPSLSLKGTKDTVFTNGNTVDVTYTANFSNANSSDYTFQWKVDGTSVNYASNPYTHTYTTIGTHKVVCTATRTGYATLTDSITTTISKGTPVVTAPTAANNLTYNTNAQTLVNAGTTTGGTLYYNVTTTNSKPAADASDWSTTLPKGTDAGTYYVWYKVVGGDNYNNVDVSDNSVAVTIAKAALSSLSVSMNNWTYGQTAQNPSVSGNTGNGAVTYSYKKSTDNTYTSTKPSDAGNYTVKASVAETDNYQAGTATKDFTINQAAGSISYTTTSLTKNVGAAKFTNTLTKVGDGTVTYSISNNGSSCSINTSTGEVTVGSTVGTATITATVTDGTNYSYASTTATYTLTVQAASLDSLIVYEGEATGGWGDHKFYFIPGETYKQAIENHAENRRDLKPGWGYWIGNSTDHTTVFYKQNISGVETVWDMTVDGTTNFNDRLTQPVDPTKTHTFSHRQ